MIYLRSTLFHVLFYGWTALCCCALAWATLLPRKSMMAVVIVYLRSLHILERYVLGIDYRVIGRENLPEGAVIVAAKHQSTWETMKLHLILNDPAVVLKQELMRLPIWGVFARKARMIPVDRGAGSKAIIDMTSHAQSAVTDGRPIVIFPQGTRVGVSTHRPYKIGVAKLYRSLNVPIVPMALNSGVLWPRKSFIKRPGTITVQFLEPIPPGRPENAVMDDLEHRLEAASNDIAQQLIDEIKPS